MPHRTEKIESTLRKALAEVFARHLSDPRIIGMISMTRVDVSPDLKNAQVYVSILPEKYEKRTLAGLRHATRHIHALASKRLALKQVPHLDFRLDRSLKKEAGILDAIREGVTRTGPPEAPPEEAPEALPTDAEASEKASPQADTPPTQ